MPLTIIVSLMRAIFFLKKSARIQRDCNAPLNSENTQGKTYTELLPLQENEMSYQPLRMDQNLGIYENHPNLPTRSATQDKAVGMDTGPYDDAEQDIHLYESAEHTKQKYTELIPVSHPENEMSYQPLRMDQDLGVYENHPNLPTRSATQDKAVGMDTEPYEDAEQDIYRYENAEGTMQKYMELIPVSNNGTNYQSLQRMTEEHI